MSRGIQERGARTRGRVQLDIEPAAPRPRVEGALVTRAIHGHRGHKDDPLCFARRTLHIAADLLTDKQNDRLQALFAAEEHVEVQATWGSASG